ncbi:Hypothetical predicted protein [Cloeon dipterum]|uniref:Uncharacterized protein n=1 Tax=Cloeon dipterum TaxID=197152 RepID=A0A8S1E7K5_9INSE|nr:Hypothetical predicted protein [Cloeon dipterum]
MSKILTRSRSGDKATQKNENVDGESNAEDGDEVTSISNSSTNQGPLSFDEHCDRWSIYFEDANITDAVKKRNQFLNYQDDKMYGVISTLCLPKKQVEPSSLVYQDKMNSRVQKETESASEFIADLHKIAMFLLWQKWPQIPPVSSTDKCLLFILPVKGSHYTRACKRKLQQANYVEVVADAEDEDAESIH